MAQSSAGHSMVAETTSRNDWSGKLETLAAKTQMILRKKSDYDYIDDEWCRKDQLALKAKSLCLITNVNI